MIKAQVGFHSEKAPWSRLKSAVGNRVTGAHEHESRFHRNMITNSQFQLFCCWWSAKTPPAHNTILKKCQARARYQRDNCFTSHNAAASPSPRAESIFLPYNKSPGQNIRRSIITFPWVFLYIPFSLVRLKVQTAGARKEKLPAIGNCKSFTAGASIEICGQINLRGGRQSVTLTGKAFVAHCFHLKT